MQSADCCTVVLCLCLFNLICLAFPDLFAQLVLGRVLKAMKENERLEAQIMKDVPGWKVGESVYNTKAWVTPMPDQVKKLWILIKNTRTVNIELVCLVLCDFLDLSFTCACCLCPLPDFGSQNKVCTFLEAGRAVFYFPVMQDLHPAAVCETKILVSELLHLLSAYCVILILQLGLINVFSLTW